jgi:hypothetical protein
MKYGKETKNKYIYLFTGARSKSRRRGDQLRPLRTEVEIAAALDDVIGDDDELLSRASSLEDLSSWIGEELQTGMKVHNTYTGVRAGYSQFIHKLNSTN